VKIELVGGPHCGTVVDRTTTPGADEVEVAHIPVPGDVWRVTYRRTGLRMFSSGRHRFDYAGQERV
jgi:hypothetical protein